MNKLRQKNTNKSATQLATNQIPNDEGSFAFEILIKKKSWKTAKKHEVKNARYK